MLFVAGIIFFLLGASEIARRLIIEVAGEVVEKEVSCSKPFNNRCVARYVILSKEGGRLFYSAGPNDHSLSRRIEIGNIVHKRKWEVDYLVNGNRVNDFPVLFYFLMVVFGCGIFVIAFFAYKRGKNSSQAIT